EYVPGRENAFPDFLSRQYEDQTNHDSNTTTSSNNQNSTSSNIDAIKTRAQARQKMVAEPSDQPALVHDQDLIVDPANLPDQNTGWPFTQEQVIQGQKNDPTLETTCRKIEKEDV
uniref:Prolactin receptor n=1 Tax=Romanomermis culicivorax TaxID=13658 RepID=A0A915KY65_ROMCU